MKPKFEYYNSLFEYRKATDEDFENFERETKLKLPKNLKKFIKKAGTKSPEPYTFRIYGNSVDDYSDCDTIYGFPGETLKEGADEEKFKRRVEMAARCGGGPNDGEDLLCVWKKYRGRIPSDLLPFGLSSSGDQICLKLEGDDAGSVWLWMHGEEYEPEDDEIPRDNCYFCAHSLKEFLKGFLDEDEIDDDYDDE